MTGKRIENLMHGEAHIAVFAFRHKSTCFAFDIRRITTTVLKQNNLLFVFERFRHFLEQHIRKMSRHTFSTVSFLCINNFNFGKFHFLVAFVQFHKSVLSYIGIEITFDRRCGRSQQGFGTVHRSQYNGCIPRMITWRRVVLLVTAFMLLVHNNKSQLAKWQKNRRTNTDNHFVTFVV